MPNRPAIFLIAALIAAPAPAVQPDDPDRRLDDAERLVPREPGRVEEFDPIRPETTSPVRPGLTAGHDWATMLEPTWPGATHPTLLPERSFVNQLRGFIVKGPQDTRLFVPAQTGDGPTPRAMLVLPCVVLERYNEYTLADQASAPALLSGQVFLYNDRNYILPTSIRWASDAAPPAEPESSAGPDDTTASKPTSPDADQGEATPAPSTANPLADNPDVAALMSELERHSPIARPPAPTHTDAAPKAADNVPIADGDYLAAQRGRIVRTPEGAWSFIPDTDGPTSRGITLLPCRTLEALEGRALHFGDAVAGLMSGRVYRYGGHTYMLPTLYQIERRDGVDPLQ
ncbi:MAG: hypothetical protein H6810_09050 [Phycisphaeraceae bacterium]|nr:MAG: hypothetical protein H6810_09050 [Phycisphaeraceae bacterium]